MECGVRGRDDHSTVLRAFAGMTLGHLRIELPDGTTHEVGTHADAAGRTLPLGLPAEAHIRVRREAFFKKCFWAGDIGFAESFIDGDWETPNLTAVVAFFILNLEDAPTLSGSQRACSTVLNVLRFANRAGENGIPLGIEMQTVAAMVRQLPAIDQTRRDTNKPAGI